MMERIVHGADWKDDVRYGMIFSAPDIEGEDGKDLHEWLTIVQRKKEERIAPAEQLNDQELLPRHRLRQRHSSRQQTTFHSGVGTAGFHTDDDVAAIGLEVRSAGGRTDGRTTNSR